MKPDKLRKTLEPKHITAIIDTREQLPLDLAPLNMTVGALTTGDYSVVGMTHVIAVERKSLQDLVACVGRERDRFDREVQRLLAYPVRGLFIEGSQAQIHNKMYRGETHPNAIIGSVMGWMAQGLPVMFCPDHNTMGLWVARYLYVAAKRRYFENLGFVRAMMDEEAPLMPEQMSHLS